MNHVSMDVEDDQALIKKVGLKCPRCESFNTKFRAYQNNQESQPRHYCKDCRRGWSVNGKLRDIPVGGGERKRRQPDVSVPDHTQKGLKCPCCESANTKFLFYENQDKSKPCHFCNGCQQHWTLNGKPRDFPVSGGKRERRQPETSVSYQGLIALECPRCKATNTKFMSYHGPNPVHFCNNCQHHWTIDGSSLRDCPGGGQKHWTVNGKLMDTPVGGGKGERQKSEFSTYDQALVARVGLECPRCKATNTKFMHYRFKNMSKPTHFCFSCRRRWTEGGKLTNRPKGGKRKIRQPETSMANKARMSQVALKCPRCESTNTNFCRHSNNNEPKPVHFCNNCHRYWSAGGSLRTKQRLKRSGLQASVEGQEETWQFEGSGEMASIGGSENNVASTECSKSLSPSADSHQPLSVWPEKFDSRIEKGNEGFPFNDEVTPNEEVRLSKGLKSVESPDPESSNVIVNSSCVEKCNSSNDFCSIAKGVEKAHRFSVDVTTTASRKQIPEPPLESGLPFIKSSFMWPQVESMEVFRAMPQQPHFNPLKEQDEHLREGEAIGLMLSFTKLVEVTRKAQLEDSRTIFDMKLKALQILEEHGFSVQPIRSQLVKLLRIKENCGQLNGRLTTVTLEVNAELESVALLDMDIQMLKEKKEMKAFKVAELQRTSVQIEESIRVARANFDEVVAAPWNCRSCNSQRGV